MRCLWVLPLVLGSALAEARPAPPVDRDRGEFWREVTDPNGDQVRALLHKVRELMLRPDGAHANDTEWAVDARTQFYRDAYQLLQHARRLAPQNVEVLALIGRAADELGETREAIDALEACVRITGLDRAPSEVTGRLGAIHLRLGDLDGAIKWLRHAQGPLTTVTAPSIVHLANALAARGQVAAAIDTLASAIPPSILQFNYSNEITLLTFSLAVVYDRDEQRSAAFDVLDHMQQALTDEYALDVQAEIAKLRFPRPEDQHYYRGLLYESLGLYAEARAEWALYAASGRMPWRARALDHIAAIDAERRAAPGPIVRAPLAPQSAIRRRLPRP